MNKKTFFAFFFFSMLGLMPLSLTSCGEDIQVPNNPNDDKIDPTEGVATVFSTSSDDTRTSMDTDRHFYWEAGDYIWVDTLKDGTFTGKSQGIELSNPTKAPSAKFYFRQIILTEQKYDLTYTGNNSNKGTEVTIAATQSQSEWNNAAHLGASGDCGVAEATRDNSTGTYSFSLKHKASYLIFQPYRAAAISDAWKLKSIEIISDNTAAGTYPFNKTDGIVTTSTIANPSNTIKLTCDDNSDFTLPQSAYSEDKSCYMVIQPGTHKLTIRYEIQPTGSVNGVANSTFYITKEVEATFKANGVRKIRHELNVNTTYSPMLYYKWDAVNPYWYGVATENIPTQVNVKGAGFPTSASDANNRWQNTSAVAPTQGSRSCRPSYIPNVNAMSWYVKKGDPRWDADYPWYINGNGGADVYTCGAWFLKSINISGFSTTATTVGGDGRQSALSNIETSYQNSSNTYKTAGRPSDTDRYFFLPALPCIPDNGQMSYHEIHGCYWTASPYPNGNTNMAYYVSFTREHVLLHQDISNCSRAYARPAKSGLWQ